MILISEALVLSPAGVPLNTPIFGWLNVAVSVTASTEDPDNPASNVLNPSTALRWVAEATGSPPSDESLTATIVQIDPVDYVAIAAHNLGSGQHAVTVEGTIGGSPEWFTLVEEHLLADDEPVIFRFTPQSLSGVRLRIAASAVEDQTTPFIAVFHVGKLLVCERGTHTDHVPINRGRSTRVMNGMSETGNFLGRVVLSESRSTTFALQHLRSAWYDAEMHPFIVAGREVPFFFAWKPQEKPREMGYCWFTGNPQANDQFGLGTKAISLQLGGVSL